MLPFVQKEMTTNFKWTFSYQKSNLLISKDKEESFKSNILCFMKTQHPVFIFLTSP